MNWLVFTADLLLAMSEVCRRYGKQTRALNEPVQLDLTVPSERSTERE
jgi:hypothetical protein